MKKKFTITIHYTIVRDEQVEADTEEEAFEIAKERVGINDYEGIEWESEELQK